MNKLRIALIGCGRISSKHFAVLTELSEYELVAVCDADKQKADKAASEQNCKAYYDYDELLKNKDIDIVNICTPSGMHPEMTMKAAKAKKHVITEKPMALNINAAKEMIKACEENNVKLFVIKQNRYNPPIQKLREAYEKGRFGKLFIINTTVRWSRPQSYYDQDEWHGTKALDGGVMLNQASHHIDLVQWFGGDVESVFGKIATMNHNIETEDTAVAILKFKSGALGVIETTTCTYPRNLEGSLTVLGEKGSVKIGGFAVNKVDTWVFEDFENDDEIIREAATNPPNVYGFGHKAYFQNVSNNLLKNKRAIIDGDEGMKSLKIIEAIYESFETGKEVFIKK